MPVRSLGSLRRRVPVLIGLLVAAGVGTYGILAYQVVRDSTVQAADARLENAAQQLAQLFERSWNAALDSARAVAGDSAVVRALLAGAAPADAAYHALERLGTPQGTLRSIELRDTSGAVVLELAGGSAADPPRHRYAEASTTPLFQVGDTVYYEAVAPVVHEGRILGSVAVMRSITTSEEAAGQIGRLIGIESGLLVGNADGSLWTDLVRVVPGPPSAGSPVVFERDGRAIRAAVSTVGETPINVSVGLPHQAVVSRHRGMLGVFTLLALGVIALGALGGWVLTRPITGALGRLADTADQIAGGDLDVVSVTNDGEDEIGRLARSFDSMAGSLRTARNTLEEQVEARTVELATALGRLRDTQEELVRQERLATLGQLSSSVGHELRNPLGVMTNGVYFLSHVLKDAPDKVREYLHLLNTQIRICEKIVADLLDFARVRPPQTEILGVADLVGAQLDRVTVPATVSVHYDFGQDVPPVAVDPIQVGQVVLNLLTNGVQAMEDGGGRLTISARREDRHVRLAVADSGAGVPTEIRGKIFEPLFTTKARGIGLGLSVSRTLARSNGGDLILADGDGPGATFVLTLPLAEASS